MAYAELAWRDFIALNFPAEITPQGTLEPTPSKEHGLDYHAGDYSAVWQTWPEARDIFLPGAAVPAGFGTGHQAPADCLRKDASGRLELTDKIVLDEYVQADRMGPVIDKQGHVLTNYHVVEDAQEIQVTMYDTKSYSATLVGFVLSRTTGLPNAPDDVGNWTEALGLASMFVEGAVIILAGYAWALAGDEQRIGFLEAAGWAPDGSRSNLDMGVKVPVVRLHTRIGSAGG